MGRSEIKKRARADINSRILAEQLTRATGVPYAAVRSVLDSLGAHIGEHLAEGKNVHITGFGKFHAARKRVRTQQLHTSHGELHGPVDAATVQVYFTKSRPLKEILMSNHTENEGMDKYAVDETAGRTSEELEKQASKGCPLCGRALERHGSTLLCPVHGSAPFEG